MLIDWFTVAAQAINFLVLVWLLKRYLYRPILAAVDAREARVMARLTEAQLREREAADAAEALAREREALEAARAERLEI
ncbi:MAG: F0F1 ATP synthase subunit B, partial [Gammaproteobacteria bacterium]